MLVFLQLHLHTSEQKRVDINLETVDTMEPEDDVNKKVLLLKITMHGVFSKFTLRWFFS